LFPPGPYILGHAIRTGKQHIHDRTGIYVTFAAAYASEDILTISSVY
jgi:hypothetical protein